MIRVVDLAECIQCSETNLIIFKNLVIDPVTCTDQFPGFLSIKPALPDGLLLKDGILQGMAYSGREPLIYTITSTNKRSLPFLLRLGGMAHWLE